jgi:DNA-binding Lrp family transcriptional regulator
MLDCVSQPEADATLQRRIVVALQDGLPVNRYPYRELAGQLGISEESLLQQLHTMQAQGSIRRIGVVPNHYALGYSHNLMVVWDIDNTLVDEVGHDIGRLDFVSHCYRRPRKPGWPYNLFTMVHGRSEDEVQQKIATVKELVGTAYNSHTALKSTRILKKTGLRIRSEEK